MNIRKVLGISLLFSLSACDTILSKGLTCEHSNDPLLKLLVRDESPPAPAHVHQSAEP